MQASFHSHNRTSFERKINENITKMRRKKMNFFFERKTTQQCTLHLFNPSHVTHFYDAQQKIFPSFTFTLMRIFFLLFAFEKKKEKRLERVSFSSFLLFFFQGEEKLSILHKTFKGKLSLFKTHTIVRNISCQHISFRELPYESEIFKMYIYIFLFFFVSHRELNEGKFFVSYFIFF